ncbi:hypothetical protein MMC24_003135 [Lignoscripta atroalba]|nr:hypothetical protein [Lignoscripta atroalba]
MARKDEPRFSFQGPLRRVTELEEAYDLGKPRSSSLSIKRSRGDDGFLMNDYGPKRLRSATAEESNDAKFQVKAAATTQIEKPDPIIRPTHVSLFQPLDEAQAFVPSKARPLPKWMVHLPSNRASTPDLSPGRRPSTPVRLPSDFSTLSAQPITHRIPPSTERYFTPLEHPYTPRSQPISPLASSKPTDQKGPPTRSLTYPERPTFTQKQPSFFPFFQNPRAPLTPAIESSWNGGTRNSTTNMAYDGPAYGESYTVGPTVLKRGRERLRSFASRDYMERYKLKHKLPKQEEGNREVAFCPICEEEVMQPRERRLGRERGGAAAATVELDKDSENGNDDDTKATIGSSQGHIYHIECLACQRCHQPFSEKNDSMAEWMWVGSHSPYHRLCLQEGVKPMLERLKRKMSGNAALLRKKSVEYGRFRGGSGSGGGGRGTGKHRQ